MKILHTEWNDAKGGQAKRVIMDLLLVRDMGFQPILVCKQDTYLYNEAQKEGIKTYSLNFKGLFSFTSYLKMYQIIKKEQVDIVHTHSSIDSQTAMVVAKLLGKKVVRSRHISLSKKPSVYYRLADKIVVTGEELVDELVSYGYNKQNIVSIGSYPDERYFDSINYPQKEEKSLVIGSLIGTQPRKRPMLLIQLAKDLKDSYPDIKFIIAGDGSINHQKKLQNEITKYHLEDNVLFTGYTDDPAKFLATINIYICPSKKEGLPQAVMQALMMGKAALSTDVGSVKQLNKDENMIIVGLDDYESLKEQLIFLLNNKDIRKELGTKSRKVMEENFSRKIALIKLKKVYMDLQKSL